MTTFTHFTDPYRTPGDPNSRFAPPAAPPAPAFVAVPPESAPVSPTMSPVAAPAPVAQPAASLDDSYFGWNGALDGFTEDEFDLLMRTVELVVQAAVFTRERLQVALRVSPEVAAKMTTSMEKLGVIAPGDPDGVRRVLINVLGLEVLLAKLLPGRQFVAAPLRAAS